MPGNTYSKISLIYDDLVRHVNYSGWAEYLQNIIDEYNISHDVVLELASGTGKLFSKLNIVTRLKILSDISIEMLTHIDKSNSRVCFDMTLIPFKRECDLVISSFDSVNHLESESRLNSLFAEVNRILKPGGYFLFDVVTEHNSFSYLDSYSKKRKTGDMKYQQSSEYDAIKKRHRNRFLITFPSGEVVEEDHFEYIFPQETIIALCESNNFKVVGTFEAFTGKKVTENTLRIQYIIRSNG
ncbi:MAG: class I SAM-dependent methyltransferase [Ignavibacteriales bacterium]|nr:class I SAM-dependent methyltransferase [Ignavibacteriales bacterium]MBK8660784.1 class I SAM-dependent methyltransferase [Ignavibacteriales bacterium]